MEPGSSDGRRGGLTDGEISTPHHIGGHRTRVVHTPTGHSPVVDPRSRGEGWFLVGVRIYEL